MHKGQKHHLVCLLSNASELLYASGPWLMTVLGRERAEIHASIVQGRFVCSCPARSLGTIPTYSYFQMKSALVVFRPHSQHEFCPQNSMSVGLWFKIPKQILSFFSYSFQNQPKQISLPLSGQFLQQPFLQFCLAYTRILDSTFYPSLDLDFASCLLEALKCKLQAFQLRLTKDCWCYPNYYKPDKLQNHSF